MSGVKNLVVEVSRYGYPIARFEEYVVEAWGRPVHLDAVYWDSEYAAYVGVGHYGKKDGSRGRQVAKPVLQYHSIPPGVKEAIDALK